MDKSSKILLALLIISLALNIRAITGISNLKKQIENTDRNNDSRLSSLQNSISGIYNTISEMNKQDQWVISREFIIDQGKSTADEIRLNAQWSFSEAESNADVYLLYSSDSNSGWVQAKAIKVGEGIYSAPMVLSPKKDYKYKFTVQGINTRTSEDENVPADCYKPIPVIVSSMNSTAGGDSSLMDFGIEVSQSGPVLFDSFKPVRIQVKVLQGDKTEKVVDLNPRGELQGRGSIWGIDNISFKESPTSIVLEVEYGDGTVDSGKIWPEDTYMLNISGRLTK